MQVCERPLPLRRVQFGIDKRHLSDKCKPTGIITYLKGKDRYYDIVANRHFGRVCFGPGKVQKDLKVFKILESDDLTSVKAVKPTNNRYALLITIIYERNNKFHIPGTLDDGARMDAFLKKKGFHVTWMNDFHYKPGDPLYPSKTNIETRIQNLVSTKKPGDVLWLHYAGHGVQQKDNIHGNVESIVPVDYRGWTGNRYIKSVWLFNKFVAKVPPSVKTMVMFDCCHSGSLLDLPFKYHKGTFVVDKDNAKNRVQEGVSVFYLAGCQDTEQAKEITWTNKLIPWKKKRGGVLTLGFLKLVREHGDDLTLTKLIDGLRDEVACHKQVPQLSSTMKVSNPEHTRFVECFDGKCR